MDATLVRPVAADASPHPPTVGPPVGAAEVPCKMNIRWAIPINKDLIMSTFMLEMRIRIESKFFALLFRSQDIIGFDICGQDKTFSPLLPIWEHSFYDGCHSRPGSAFETSS